MTSLHSQNKEAKQERLEKMIRDELAESGSERLAPVTSGLSPDTAATGFMRSSSLRRVREDDGH